MIDPVRRGPVAPGVAPVTSASARRPMLQSAAQADARPSASLPKLLDLVADLSTAAPPVDYARIAEVRRAIADGSYTINADVIAKAISSFAAKA